MGVGSGSDWCLVGFSIGYEWALVSLNGSQLVLAWECVCISQCEWVLAWLGVGLSGSE